MPKKKDTLKTLSVDRRTNESNEEFVVRAWGAGESAIDEIRRREEKEEELHKAIKNKNYRRIARLVR